MLLYKSGDERARTANPRLAKPVLSQLSYVPSTVLEKRQGGDTVNVQAPRLPLASSGRTKIRTWDLVVISDAL